MLNRDRIFAAIQELLDLAAAGEGCFAVVFVRVLGLREIRLRFGYERGEQAEQNARTRMEQSLRPIDQVHHAGDESFAVVLPGLRNRNHVLLAVTRLVSAFELPLVDASAPWQGRAVMGVVVFPEHGRTPDELCRRAETALDIAQRRGEQYAFDESTAVPTEIIYEDFRDAIENNRLQIHFQPVWNLQTNCLGGAESLARWTDTNNGTTSPADFVPFAEQSDLILALTRWSLNATLRYMASLPPAHGLRFAFNVSPRVFAKPGLVEELIDALSIWGVLPSALIAEVTETALVNDLDLSVQVLRRLRETGIGIAIDDFGTGFASISYLRKFPATELKIDQSLIRDIGTDEHTAKLVRAVISMAHALDMEAVAEGIEDQSTQDLLADMRCDFGQGYHLGRPEPAADFVARFSMQQPPQSR
ncbi:MAG: GGDEF domain-containing phosphodiesterase [Dokdonella sp.]